MLGAGKSPSGASTVGGGASIGDNNSLDDVTLGSDGLPPPVSPSREQGGEGAKEEEEEVTFHTYALLPLP